jgi:peroxiredoxin
VNLQRIYVLSVLVGLFAKTDMRAQSPNGVSSPSVAAIRGVFGAVSVRLKAGDFAPDIVFTKVLEPAGGSWNSADLFGKTTVLVFFPLVSRNPQAMTMWNAVVERFAGKPVQFVLITSEKESSLLPWLAQHPVSGSVLYDPDGQTGRAYGLEMPDMVYIGADRKIVGFQQGTVPDDRTLNAVLEGHITTTRPKPDLAPVKAFLASGLVPLDAESSRMPRPEDQRPAFPPSDELHVSPAKDDLGSGNSSGDDFWSLQGFTLKSLIAEIYDLNPIRIVLPASLDDGKRYDFAIVLPEPKSREEKRRVIEQGIQDYFHITVTRAEHLLEVYVVTAPNGTPPATTARQAAGRMGGGFRSYSIGFGSVDQVSPTQCCSDTGRPAHI